MKAVFFNDHGPVTNIKFGDLPEPVPQVGEAMVKVRAISLNGFDPMVLASIPGLKTPLPMVPGGDIAGEIVAFGEGARSSTLEIGDRVVINPLVVGKGIYGETISGGACEFVCAPLENIVSMPAAVSFEDAAALPIAYGTAHRMLIKRAEVRSGDRVLILGATGGVGTCCVQLAKLAGAEVAACTSSGEKAEKLRNLGADHIINTSEGDFVKQIHKVWGKPRVFDESGGADIVINFVGGDDWAKALRCVKRGGKMLTCGATNGYDPKTDIRYIWSFELNIMGSNCWDRSDIESLLDLTARGQLKPEIASLRPYQELATSLQDMIDRKNFGKAVLTIA
ncbi:alcohol dehydrogenase [Tardiphaga sp. OK246]|uniref:zinc-binding dehydrogenase n=1 Tax=Tardiphaga sp. OK246 TaxID=1855307 RepID=UPI000B71F6B7|nr:zinc-binding dehydrogenase [Tardiphaga sp. OK246]SNT32657.1 alcohol dehydrogenase [Tardiphaga sp. OK246]